MCGSRASEPSSRSRVGLHDTRTGHGYWREQARRSLWRVVKSCVWELPVRALVPLSGSRPHAYSSALHACFQQLPSCTHWPQGGLGGKTAQAMRFDFILARTEGIAANSLRWVSRARISWKGGPPRTRSVNSWEAGGL